MKELGEKLSRVNMPNMDGYVVFIYWSLFVTGEDPRYVKSERLEELWARWNIEAPDAVRAVVEKYERDGKEKERYQAEMRRVQLQNINGQTALMSGGLGLVNGISKYLK